jgi:hypothetical protein
MIRQDGNGNQNNGRSTQRNSSRIPIVSDVLDMFGGGGQPEMQTTTQQTLPDWAMGYAQNTLNLGNQYTMNPNYRPSTLDRDYSGIRGYNAQGQPNSQVGQFGLSPTPQTSSITSSTPITSGMTVEEQRATMDPAGTMMIGPDMSIPVSQLAEYDRLFAEYAAQNPGNEDPNANRDYAYQQIMGSEGIGRTPSSRGMGRSTGYNYSDGYGSGDYTYSDQGTDNYYGSDTYDGSFTDPGAGQVNAGDNANTPGAWSAEDVRKAQAGQGKLTVADGFVPFENTTTSSGTSSETSFDPSQMTPFQAYDRQRFAAPSDRTVQGENLLANRVNGLNPFAEAQAAARGASNYQSQFSPAALNLTGPKANTYNNVNQGLLAEEYGNANQGLTPAQNYSRAFQENLAQFQDPYTSQVVDQTIQDLDRARRITNNDISGNAARVGAFGGSREALMRTENNRNFADRTAAAVGQLRSQGFQQAAERAQQEQLQRLGLTASDIQNLRGYQSAGNLQGQNISAQDVRDVRGLQSQGALTAQGLSAQSARDAMGFQNQLQMQGNQLGVEQARLAEQFRQGAGALNLQGAGALGNLAQMQTADERQRIADLLAAGGAGDARNQQDLDFIFSEFNRELDYPGRQIDLRNAAISPATGSIVTTTQPRYSSGGLPQAAGAGLATYGALAGIPAAAPYALPAALAMGLLNY